MTSSTTADLQGALAHARAQADTVAEFMPTTPPSSAKDIPQGVAPEAMLWAETIAPGGYAAKRLDRGARLRLIDVGGDASVSMLVFNAGMPTERLNVADTIKVQWNAYLAPSRLLLSDLGKVLFSIVDMTATHHDTICGASNAASNARRYGDGDNWGSHPNARDRLALGVSKFGLTRRDVHPCINWFKGVRVAQDGTLHPELGPFAPGGHVTLRAEQDVIVVLANCPHVLDPRPDYTVTAARVLAWRGPPTALDDEIRNATPEGRRAFLNVEEDLRR